ncbi:hypothetical protein ABZU92_18300 [Micromonospora arida]|uniref:hypothetical protein n=1 Tax=Micromonospora arida TaxID=2203715 RepID=UPI0033B04073
MTVPQLIVEIGFTAPLTGTALHIGDASRGIIGTATLAPTGLLTDVSEFVTQVTTRRGATRADGPYLRYEGGSATIRFRNDDRRFDPTNLAGPYVAVGRSQVEPMRAVRIRAVVNGVAHPVWRGFVDQWTVGYDGPNSSWTEASCFDAFALFNAHQRPAVGAVGAGETTSARLTRILNGISWPTPDRSIIAGDETVQATTLSGDALTEMLLVVDSELGGLWMDASGRLTFRPRSYSYTNVRAIYPLAHFGDQAVGGVDTTINLVSNPSLEVDTAGWVTVGTVPPTIARDNTRAMFGSWSLKATWGTGGALPGVAYDIGNLVIGRTYTISVYVWVPSGSIGIDSVVAGQGFGGSTGGLVDQWVRLTWTGTANATTIGFGLWPAGVPVGGETVSVDGLQVEEGSTASAYVDGTQPYCQWDGIAHASTSRRLPELPYQDVEPVYDALSITNTVRAARTGGTEQTAVNGGSVSAYLTRSHTRMDLVLQTDAEVLMWAEQIVARTALPELRFEKLTLKGDDPRLWLQMFGREISERVRVTRRPPGGGAPIVRDGWVRGVEHTLTVDQDWKTVLVLEQARDTVTVLDGFGTNATNSWGGSWVNSGSLASEFQVSGGSARHIHAAAGVLHVSLIELGSPNAQTVAEFINPMQPAGGAITEWVVMRAADANNYYTAQLSISTGNVVTISLLKRVGGSLSGLAGASTSIGSTSSGQTWRLVAQAVGSLVRAKAWRPAVDSEPGWQVAQTDNALTAGTQVGVLTRMETGNSNTKPYTIFVDNVVATSQHAWV